MRYINFRGLELSCIGLGTWINFGGKTTDAENHKIFDRCLSLGINVIDTAHSYEDGGAEVLLGKLIRPRLRKELFLSTKVFFRNSDTLPQTVSGLNKKAFKVSLDESLLRLKTDYIDLLYLHRFDEKVPVEDIASSIGINIQAGKILYWGTSRWPLAKIEKLIQACIKQNVPLPTAMQEPCNYLFPLSAETKTFTAKHGMQLFLYSPLARGALSGKYHSKEQPPQGSRGADKRYATTLGAMDDTQNEHLNTFLNLAHTQKISPVEFAYRYIFDTCKESVVLGGFSKTSQMKEAASSLLPLAREVKYG